VLAGILPYDVAVPTAYVVLIRANVVYGSSYAVSRVVLEHMGPATLSFCRLAIGSLVLVPLALAQRREDQPLSRSDRWSIFWMGLSGFAAAFAFGNWGLRLSTATNAALLITVDRKSTRLNSSHVAISYAVFCLKKKKIKYNKSINVMILIFKIIV